VSKKRKPLEVVVLGLNGRWVRLEAVKESTAAHVDELASRWETDPAMAGRMPSGGPSFLPPMLVLENQTGKVIGVAVNQRHPGDVATFMIYLDPERSRRGYGFEATAMYLCHLFEAGARLVNADVLSFNPTNNMLTKGGVQPQARLREHVYTAGRFWDVNVFSFTQQEWMAVIHKYRKFLPGGSRGAVALGGWGT
jgi:RimJ/RimL family protein N-acetyltransferase